MEYAIYTISYGLWDIACTFKLAISLTLTDKRIVHGIASNILYNQDRQHCILIKEEQKQTLIVLDTIKSMTALTPNPHLDAISFDTLRFDK